MSKELVASSANPYLVPITQGEGEGARTVNQPMAELVFMTVEADYNIDDKGRIVKGTKLYTDRVHVSLQNLDRTIHGLEEIRDRLQVLGIDNEQQRAGVDPAQMSLPGVLEHRSNKKGV